MAKLAANAPCPCGSGRKGKSCCGPILDGAPAPTPEALMRSRYTAYATGNVGHVMRTTATESPHRNADARTWQAELEAYCAAVRFEGLTVEDHHEAADHGTVRFLARLSHDGRDLSFEEHSRFVRRDGRWYYVDRIADGA